jgi:two-component system sensor histidine kinase TctE
VRVSIKKQLFVLLVPVLLGLWFASAGVSYWLVSQFTREAFDRDLVNSADSVVGRVRVKDGKVSVDLPPAAQAVLKHDQSDKLYYRVLSADGRLISGDADLPAPLGTLRVDTPYLLTVRISGKNVRLAEIKASVDDAPGETVFVQMAETTNVRSLFQQKMLLSMVVPQLLMIVLALCAIRYGVMRILAPLRDLQQQVTSRSQSDLTGLSEEGSPAEVYPLVHALNRLFERLAEELKSHRRFIANAAHQLRTPLAGLKTYSSIATEASSFDELKHVVSELDQGIDRASRVVSQLLALARTDGGDPAIVRMKIGVDMNCLVSDVVSDLIRTAVAKDLDLSFESSNNTAIVHGEPEGLRHLVTNLIENAILYTPPGGQVIVRLNEAATNGRGSKVILTVADTGPGIPPAEREKVFERFYRITGTNGVGSGLGLAIVREVANAHNAKVSIESQLLVQGTSVVIEFGNSPENAPLRPANASLLQG